MSVISGIQGAVNQLKEIRQDKGLGLETSQLQGTNLSKPLVFMWLLTQRVLIKEGFLRKKYIHPPSHPPYALHTHTYMQI